MISGTLDFAHYFEKVVDIRAEVVNIRAGGINNRA